MGKSRDLFEKTGDTKGICHAKMGTIKDRNSKNLTEASEIKRGQEDAIVQKVLNDPNNHNGVVTNLGPDIRSVNSRGP